MRSVSALLLLVAALAASACGEDPGAARAREVVQDLAAQEFARATSRYGRYEAEVLSPGAAPVWRRALEHQDPTVREWAIDSLAHIGESQDVDPIAALLDDSSRGVRQQALDALLRLDAGRAESESLERLRREASDQVVLGAEGLARRGRPELALPVLERFTDTDLPEATRGALTQPLATLGNPAVAEALADVAADPAAGAQLRRLAAEALVVLDGDGVRGQIERLIDSDDEYVRTLAAQALEAMEPAPER